MERFYRTIGKVSVGAVLFLILVGGIVRSTGSGMGCPDWPTCFGLIVPPTEVTEIPASFFAAFPEYESQTFNADQSWVEYINRLIGALIGLFVFATAAASLIFWRRDRRIVLLSFAALVLTGFEAWLGKIVVDKHLEGGFVTIHMFGAILILSTLMLAVYLAAGHADRTMAIQPKKLPARIRWIGAIALVITLAQILIGTQVREHVDEIAISMNNMGRETWIDQLGGFYSLHQGLWMVVTGLVVYWGREIWTKVPNRNMRLLVVAMYASLGLEVAFGILLSYMDLPPALQPLHLLLANILFAGQLGILLNVWGAERLLAGWVRLPKRNNSRNLVNAK